MGLGSSGVAHRGHSATLLSFGVTHPDLGGAAGWSLCVVKGAQGLRLPEASALGQPPCFLAPVHAGGRLASTRKEES